jgi:hypothetical protein
MLRRSPDYSLTFAATMALLLFFAVFSTPVPSHAEDKY